MASDAYGERPTIEEVKALQASLPHPEYHIVWFDEEGFVMAHTNEERASLPDLEDCPLHQELAAADEMLVPSPGYYMYLPGWKKFMLLPAK